MEDPERQQPAPHALEDLVDVGQEDGQASRLPVQLDEGCEVRVEDGLELAGQVVELRVGVPDEAPVLFPGAVVDLLGERQLLVEASHIEEADYRIVASANPLDQAYGPLSHRLIPHEEPGV